MVAHAPIAASTSCIVTAHLICKAHGVPRIRGARFGGGSVDGRLHDFSSWCLRRFDHGRTERALDSVDLSTRTRSEAVTGTCEAAVAAGSYGRSEPKCAAGWSWRSPRSGRAKAYRDPPQQGRLICLSEKTAQDLAEGKARQPGSTTAGQSQKAPESPNNHHPQSSAYQCPQYDTARRR